MLILHQNKRCQFDVFYYWHFRRRFRVLAVRYGDSFCAETKIYGERWTAWQQSIARSSVSIRVPLRRAERSRMGYPPMREQIKSRILRTMSKNEISESRSDSLLLSIALVPSKLWLAAKGCSGRRSERLACSRFTRLTGRFPNRWACSRHDARYAPGPTDQCGRNEANQRRV